jgi:hypothetical protein
MKPERERAQRIGSRLILYKNALANRLEVCDRADLQAILSDTSPDPLAAEQELVMALRYYTQEREQQIGCGEFRSCSSEEESLAARRFTLSKTIIFDRANVKGVEGIKSRIASTIQQDVLVDAIKWQSLHAQDEELSIHDERDDERLKGWWPLKEQHQTEVRAHSRWLFVLAGALASFSVPLLAADNLIPTQRVLIALAVVAFLALIGVGVWRMNWILRDWGKALSELRAGLTSNDQNALAEYKRREQKSKREEEQGDTYGTAVHVLFTAGIVFLVASILVMLLR